MTTLYCGSCAEDVGEATATAVGVIIRTRTRLPHEPRGVVMGDEEDLRWVTSEFHYRPGSSLTCPECTAELRCPVLDPEDARIILDPW